MYNNNSYPSNHREVGTRTQIYNNNTSSFQQLFMLLLGVGGLGAIIYVAISVLSPVTESFANHTTTDAVSSVYSAFSLTVSLLVFLFFGVVLVLVGAFVLYVIHGLRLKMKARNDEYELNRPQYQVVEPSPVTQPLLVDTLKPMPRLIDKTGASDTDIDLDIADFNLSEEEKVYVKYV